MEDAIILKTDSLLRVVTPPDQREALLDAFERSSASAKAFAAEHGIKYPTFAAWAQRRRRERAAGGGFPQPCEQGLGRASVWIEAVAGGPAEPRSGPQRGCQGLAVELPGGARFTLRDEADAALAAALLAKLAGSALAAGPAALQLQPQPSAPRHA